jgi:hypothetical protein
VRWPKYIRLQRQKAIIIKRLKVPPSINQFTQALDRQTGEQHMLKRSSGASELLNIGSMFGGDDLICYFRVILIDRQLLPLRSLSKEHAIPFMNFKTLPLR